MNKLYNSIITKISTLQTKENIDIIEWIESSKDDFTYEQLREISDIVDVENYNKAVSKKLLDYLLQNTEEDDEVDEQIEEEQRRIEEEQRRIEEEQRQMEKEAEQIKKEILKKKDSNPKSIKKTKPNKILRFSEIVDKQDYEIYDYNPIKKSKYEKNRFRKYINKCLEEKKISLEGKLLDELYIFISNVYSNREKYQTITRKYKIQYNYSNSGTISIRKKNYDKKFICALINYFLKSKKENIIPNPNLNYIDYIMNSKLKHSNIEYSNSSSPISRVSKTLSFFNKSFRGGKNIKLNKSKKSKK